MSELAELVLVDVRHFPGFSGWGVDRCLNNVMITAQILEEVVPLMFGTLWTKVRSRVVSWLTELPVLVGYAAFIMSIRSSSSASFSKSFPLALLATYAQAVLGALKSPATIMGLSPARLQASLNICLNFLCSVLGAAVNV